MIASEAVISGAFSVSREAQDGAMSGLRKRLFIGMAHNAASPITYFRLPQSRTVSLGSTLYL